MIQITTCTYYNNSNKRGTDWLSSIYKKKEVRFLDLQYDGFVLPMLGFIFPSHQEYEYSFYPYLGRYS